MKIQSIFQNSVAAKVGEKETHQSSGDSQNFQFTLGEVDQSKVLHILMQMMPNIDLHIH